jgi:ATP-dependent DNA helicase RecQ
MAPVGRRKSVRASTAMGTSLTKETLNEEQRALWEALRELRRRIAAEQGVPPYVILHDATLLAMVEHRPRSEELLVLSGVGRAKLEKHGARFVDSLNKRDTRLAN